MTGSEIALPRELAEIWPLFGLRIIAGPLQLRPVHDEDIPLLVAVAQAGVHPPDTMPFMTPWTAVPPEQLPRNMAAHYWRIRCGVAWERWTVDLVVRWHGEVVGVQGFSAENYLVTHTGETGSWLGQRHQGRGIGTLMRQTLCGFAFDHLDAEVVMSGAWVDNAASLAVSRKVGYRHNGMFREQRRPGEAVALQRLSLVEPDLVRHGYDVQVEGLAPVREFLGLDA